MPCRTGCPTQDHNSWGECLLASNIHIGQIDATAERKKDKELSAYRDARRQGVQPAGTTMAKVRRAMEISERTGKAYDASAPLSSGVTTHAFE